jgi:hypothetical protein
MQPTLDHLGVKPTKPPPGGTEVGVRIPHNLFDGRLDEFARELGVLNSMIRTLSEVTTGSAEEAQVRQISSTNPEIFLAVSLPVTLAIAGTVTWALDTWKKVEEIRKLRAETQKLKGVTKEEIEGFFDSKIKKEVDLAVEERAKHVFAQSKTGARQPEEMKAWLDWVLRSFLSRIERGMTVEIRFSEPAPEPENADKKTQKVFEELKAGVQQLKFPPADPAPVLELPPPHRPAPRKGV